MGDWSSVEWLGAWCPSISFEGLFCFVKFNVCCCCINNWASASELASKEFVKDLFSFLGLLFSGDYLAESLLLLLEPLPLVEQCRFIFLFLGLVAGICLARLLTAFARVAIDLLCFLYSPSSLKTLSEVSIVVVLLILLLECSDWSTGCVRYPGWVQSEYRCYFQVHCFQNPRYQVMLLLHHFLLLTWLPLGIALITLITKTDVDYFFSLHLILFAGCLKKVAGTDSNYMRAYHML